MVNIILALFDAGDEFLLEILHFKAFLLKFLQVHKLFLLFFTHPIKSRIKGAFNSTTSKRFDQLRRPDNLLQHPPSFFFEPKIPLMPTQVASFNELKQDHWMRTFPKPTRETDKHAKRLQEGGKTQHNQSVEGTYTVCSDEATRHNQVDESHSESHPMRAQDLINPFLVRFLFLYLIASL